MLDAFLVVEQLLDGFRDIPGQKVAHRFAPVLGAEIAAELDQAHQRQPAPFILVRDAAQHQRRLLLGVIDQCGEVAALGTGHRIGKSLLDHAVDRTGSVTHHMLESLMFAVDVGEEMLGSLGKLEQGRQIDDRRRRRLDRGVFLRQKFQVFQRDLWHIVSFF